MKPMEKNSRKLSLLFVIFMSLLFCIPILTNCGTGYDLYFHLFRFQGIKEALQAHSFPINIYPFHNFGFGYGSPLFYCDIFILLPALLYTLGVPLIICYKLTLCFYIVLGNVLMYIALKHIYKNNNLIIYSGVLLYCFSGNKICDIFERGALSSVIAYSFIPLILYSVYELINDNNDCWLLLGLSFSLVLLSHILTFLTCCICFLLIILFNIKHIINNKKYITIFKAIIFAFCISCFFLFPLLEQRISQDLWMDFTMMADGERFIKSSQLTLDYLLYLSTSYSEYTYGIVQIILCFALYVFYKVKNRIFCHIDMLFIVFIISSCITWNFFDLSKFSILYSYQFLWRILLITYIFVIILILELQTSINNKQLNIIVLIIIICFNSYSYISFTRKFNNVPISFNLNNIITNEDVANDMHGTDYIKIMRGEYLPYTNSYDYYHAPKCITFANEDGYVFDYDRIGTTITFTSDIDYQEKVYMPLSWYKGYYVQELDDNGNVLSENECFYNEYNKRVGFTVDKGKHIYRVYYKGTIVQKASYVISFFAFAYLLYAIYKKKQIL